MITSLGAVLNVSERHAYKLGIINYSNRHSHPVSSDFYVEKQIKSRPYNDPLD